MELLLEGGYGALTIRQIAQRAGASATTIYRRWPTKEDLVIAALNRLPVLVPRNLGSVLDDLGDIYRQYGQVAHSSALRAVPILVNESEHNPTLASAVEAFMEQRRVPLRICFVRGIDRGELPENTNVELVIDMLQGAVFLRSYLISKRLSPKWLNDMLAVLLKGLGASPRALQSGNT